MNFYRLLFIIAAVNFPILHLFVPNEGFVHDGGLWLPVLLVTGLSLLVFIVLNLLIKKTNNSAFISVLVLMSIQIYGHLYYGIMDGFELPYSTFKHRFFFPLFIFLFGLPIYILLRVKDVKTQVIKIACIMFLVLSMQFMPKLFVHYFNQEQYEPIAKNEHRNLDTPNFYYIILDSYSNQQNILEFYSYDNSSFIDKLKGNGFNVIEEAKSNYPYTYFSLASSLNMRYVNDFEDSLSTGRYNDDFPFLKIHKNEVADYLREKGYQYVLSKSAYGPLNEPRNADVYIDNNTIINPFHQALLSLSILSVLDVDKIYEDKIFVTTKEAFSNWREILDLEGSRFTFFHCLAPHPPLVFKADGSFNAINQNVPNRYNLKSDYVEQLKYVNSSVLGLVDQILKKEN